MRWLDWQPVYLDIVSRLNLDPAMDREATRLLTEILTEIEPRPLLRQLQERIQGETVVICGAGPSLETHLQSVMDTKDGSSFVYVAADGAVSALLDLGCECSIIATDLDGNLDDIEEAMGRGAVTIVHGHGDNMDKVREVVPNLGTVLGSTQVEPTERAFLWGGFTDGDRACYMVVDHSPGRIILAGMDFGSLVGKWSKPMHEEHFPASKRKRIKLDIAKQLISSVIDQSSIPFTILK